MYREKRGRDMNRQYTVQELYDRKKARKYLHELKDQASVYYFNDYDSLM